jgi:hypothetical protein
MTRILNLFQIKTIRSAWVFLVGSGLLFIFGVYQALSSPTSPSGAFGDYFEIIFFSFWFFVSGSYMAIACWALFSAKGRLYLETQEKIPIRGNREILWYLKFLFACFAAAFATMMLIGVLALPFAGYAGLEIMSSPNRGLYLLITGLIWSPLIFRYLK